MKSFFCLFKRELAATFLSPVAYVVIVFFWMLTGGSFWWLLDKLAQGESLLMVSQWLFGAPIMWFSMPVVIPIITMRLFAEERKLGTLESLLTTQVRPLEVVLAKFAATLVFYMVMWLPVLVYAQLLSGLGPEGLLDAGALRAGALGVALVGSVYISVGLLMSSLSANQIIASISSFAILSGAFFVGLYMAYSSQNPTVKLLGLWLSTLAHMLDFARGIVDSRQIVLYLSLTAFFLFATVKTVETKRP